VIAEFACARCSATGATISCSPRRAVRLRAAGCPGSAHGLRKAGATRAAERGASERQLMAIFGWSTDKMAQHYTRTADRARLAQSAAEFLMPAAHGIGE
jgi:integrase